MAKAQSRRWRAREEGSCSDLWSGLPLTISATVDTLFFPARPRKVILQIYPYYSPSLLPPPPSSSSSSSSPPVAPSSPQVCLQEKSWALLFLWLLGICTVAWCGFFLVGEMMLLLPTGRSEGSGRKIWNSLMLNFAVRLNWRAMIAATPTFFILDRL